MSTDQPRRKELWQAAAPCGACSTMLPDRDPVPRSGGRRDGAGRDLARRTFSGSPGFGDGGGKPGNVLYRKKDDMALNEKPWAITREGPGGGGSTSTEKTGKGKRC